MAGRLNEVRDPVHTFIDFDGLERAVIDSLPFQRLRHIHQLALSGQVYPGASHKRFEHSLGVMHLAGRIFDIVTKEEKLTDDVRDLVPRRGEAEFSYWRTVLRVAALCHDIGHLPFSHAAEDDLLPEGWDHERITRELIQGPMAEVWSSVRPEPNPEDVVKLALGPKKVASLKLDLSFTDWEGVLAEIITSDALGADRIDYLLRDSLHTGVAYGRFDHNRLIQTMRILPSSPERDAEETGGEGGEPQLGIERGGLESAEALLLARYFMFAQVYYHPTRLIYDQHLKDFLSDWLPAGRFPIETDGHLSYSDNEVWAGITAAAADDQRAGHDPARRIARREHFRVIDERQVAEDVGERSLAVSAVYEALGERYGTDNVRFGRSPKRGEAPDFPVMQRDGKVASSVSLSEILAQLPVSRDEYVFMPAELRDEARRWLKKERSNIVTAAVDKVERESDEQKEVEEK